MHHIQLYPHTQTHRKEKMVKRKTSDRENRFKIPHKIETANYYRFIMALPTGATKVHFILYCIQFGKRTNFPYSNLLFIFVQSQFFEVYCWFLRGWTVLVFVVWWAFGFFFYFVLKFLSITLVQSAHRHNHCDTFAFAEMLMNDILCSGFCLGFSQF